MKPSDFAELGAIARPERHRFVALQFDTFRLISKGCHFVHNIDILFNSL